MIHDILIDTREQKPYDFEADSLRLKLDTGDYSIMGLTDKVTVERKSLSDFLGCLFPHKKNKNGGWVRFEKELIRMQEFDYKCIVIETTWKKIVGGKYGHSKAHPNSVMGKIMKITVDMGIPIYFVSDHTEGAKFVEKYLTRVESTIHIRGSNPEVS